MAYIIECKKNGRWTEALPDKYEDLEKAEETACRIYTEEKVDVRVVDERYRE